MIVPKTPSKINAPSFAINHQDTFRWSCSEKAKISSQIEGNKRASAELLTAPTKEMARPNCGTNSASVTEKSNIRKLLSHICIKIHFSSSNDTEIFIKTIQVVKIKHKLTCHKYKSRSEGNFCKYSGLRRLLRHVCVLGENSCSYRRPQNLNWHVKLQRVSQHHCNGHRQLYSLSESVNVKKRLLNKCILTTEFRF